MAGRDPDIACRNSLTMTQLIQLFPDDRSAEAWFEVNRWPDGRFCPDCGSTDTVEASNRRPMPYRCRSCLRYFSVRTGTVLQSAKAGLQKWAIAIFQMSTGLKGITSIKLHRDLGVRQATAWFMMHRIREGFDRGNGMVLPRPLETDNTFVSGKPRTCADSDECS